MRREKAAVAATLLSPVLAASAAGLQGTVQDNFSLRKTGEPAATGDKFICVLELAAC
jgi:hypothetical protein